uniref:Uncharacterized protein n=1 Tax=Eutreptiella gymnastica TaxID=73025 RepID=A0A7S1HUG8_9EUGL|mmetsp:Transcript_106671/g.183965  ORF Transcript_106671/g.183965 Transcript_106671/m.183965 type:complete len:312 (+) Transcript_106671:86-1021(+)
MASAIQTSPVPQRCRSDPREENKSPHVTPKRGVLWLPQLSPTQQQLQDLMHSTHKLQREEQKNCMRIKCGRRLLGNIEEKQIAQAERKAERDKSEAYFTARLEGRKEMRKEEQRRKEKMKETQQHRYVQLHKDTAQFQALNVDFWRSAKQEREDAATRQKAEAMAEKERRRLSKERLQARKSQEFEGGRRQKQMLLNHLRDVGPLDHSLRSPLHPAKHGLQSYADHHNMHLQFARNKLQDMSNTRMSRLEKRLYHEEQELRAYDAMSREISDMAKAASAAATTAENKLRQSMNNIGATGQSSPLGRFSKTD